MSYHLRCSDQDVRDHLPTGMNNSDAEEDNIINTLPEDIVASEVEKTLSDDECSYVHVTVCTSPQNDDDEHVSVVGVGPVSTNHIPEHRDLSNNTQMNLCNDPNSNSSIIDDVSTAITVSILSGNSTIVTNPVTPPRCKNIPQSRHLNYPDCNTDASHANTVEGAILEALSPGTSSNVPCRMSRRRININNSRDKRIGNIDNLDGEGNFGGYDSDGAVNPFLDTESEELRVHDKAILDHDPPPLAPLPPSEVIPESPK